MQISAATNIALCELLDAATDAMHMAGIHYMGAAGDELYKIELRLAEPLREWTDAEGQRVRQWVAEMDYFDRHKDERARRVGFLRAASHVHRLVLQRLLRNLGLRWPADGLMLNPPPAPNNGPQPISSLNNVDLPPGHFVSVTTHSPGQPSKTSYFNEHGEVVDKRGKGEE